MKVRKIKPVYEDSRGTIIDILRNEWIDNVSLIRSKSGAIRGNHYHQDTLQCIYVLCGQMRLVTQIPGAEVKSVILHEGDLAITPAGESHAFEVITDTDFMVFTRGPRGGGNYEKDTYRLEVPLVLQPSAG